MYQKQCIITQLRPMWKQTTLWHSTVSETSLFKESVSWTLMKYQKQCIWEYILQYFTECLVPPGSYPVSAVDFYGNMSQNIAPICHLTTPSSTTWFWQTRAMTTTIFIAPTTGVYAFHFSVCVILSLEVTWNGNAIGSIFAEGSVYRKGYH